MIKNNIDIKEIIYKKKLILFILNYQIIIYILKEMNKGYHKYKNDYIIEIGVIKKIKDTYNIINKDTATYWTNKFKVLSITNWKTDNTLDEIDNYKINKIIEIDNEDLFSYNLSKELSICNFFDDRYDEEIYLKNKCGVYTNYHNNGQIYRTFFHNNGIEEGEYKEYTPDGKIKAERFYINGKKYGKSTIYHNNGQLYTISNYIDGKLEGVYEEYHKNGNLRMKLNFVNDNEHGKFESYYDNGCIDESGIYENGKQQGEWLSYFYSGDLCKKLYYEDDELINYVDLVES